MSGDIARVVAMLQATAEIMGQPLSEEALALLVKDLADKNTLQIEKALETIRRDGEGRLTLQKILVALPAVYRTPPAFQLTHEKAPAPPPDRGPQPDTDDEAVAEAKRRVRSWAHSHIWSALWAVTQERETEGGMRVTEAGPATKPPPEESPLPPLAGNQTMPYRKHLPPNPFLDDEKETADGKEKPGAEARS